MNHPTTTTAQAISIPAWESLQRAPGEACVLGRFERVVDLLLGDDLVALATPDVGCGPFHLVVDALPATPLPERVALRVLPGALWIGPWQIALPAELPLWNPRPAWEQLTCAPSQLAVLRAVVSEAARAGNVSPLAQVLYSMDSITDADQQRMPDRINEWEPDGQNSFMRCLIRGRQARQFTILSRPNFARSGSGDPDPERGSGDPLGAFFDSLTLEEAVTALAGWGPGLTPSGDDFLAGLMLSLWAREGEAARPLCVRIAAAAAPRTTRLSGAFLRAAAEGLADERWHALLHTLATGPEAAIARTAQAVLAFGASSGLDMLTGFLWRMGNG